MNKTNRKPVEILEVEDEEARQGRIKTLLENLNESSFGRAESTKPGFDFGDRTTFPIKPPTELLSRVQAFLPQLQASNVALEKTMQVDPTSVDIEHLSEGMNQYIEMNLGLGLFEERSKRNHSESDEDAEMTSSSSEFSSSITSSDREISFGRSKSFEYEEEYDSDESSDAEIITCFVPRRPMKPLPRRATNPNVISPPGIVVVGEENASHSSD